MKKHIAFFCTASFFAITAHAQFANTPTLNTADQSTGGNVGIGTGAPAAKLHVLSTGNQLRLGYSGTLFSNITTTSNGNLALMQPAGGRIGLGIDPTIAGIGVHSVLGTMRLTDATLDPGSTKGLQFMPAYINANGEVPAGSVMASLLTTSGQGLSLLSNSNGQDGVKLGAYAFVSNTPGIGGWKSVWETANTSNYAMPNLILVKNAGNVGIGTGATTPTSRLEIQNGTLSTSAGSMSEWQKHYTTIGSNQVNLRIFNKRYASGSNWMSSEIRIQNSVDASSLHYISFKGAPNNHSYLVFGMDNTELVSISDLGQVAIGTQKITSGSHTDAKLTVDGKFVSKAVYVTANGWADYVFEPDYKLPDLYETEKYYLSNKHLPEVPSEKEILENGIDVAEMNKLMLKKIEEMTIQMVKLQKEVDALKASK